MKKPFISLRRPRDIIRLFIAVLLCICALSLFEREESLPVFANSNNGNSPKGLYDLVESTAF